MVRKPSPQRICSLRCGSRPTWTSRHVTIVECRPPWEGKGDWERNPVARLRFTKKTGLWSLYWLDRNERFHSYDRIGANQNVQVLLNEIDQDPTCIFWG